VSFSLKIFDFPNIDLHVYSVSEVFASFGEMLLLMAIDFHIKSRISAKIPLRQNNTPHCTRMKQIFTQEIFTEQVVCAHAIKVPVTVNLNVWIHGYLPVHCLFKAQSPNQKLDLQANLQFDDTSSSCPASSHRNLRDIYYAKRRIEHTHKPYPNKKSILFINELK
jgi:hypothetical protein